MPVGAGRFRVVTRGKKQVRLHFDKSGDVNEAKVISGPNKGATHTPAEFKKDEKQRQKKMPKRGSGELSPLGSRTLDGYNARWGEEGHTKFETAVDSGLLDRAKMLKNPRREAGGQFQRRTG